MNHSPPSCPRLILAHRRDRPDDGRRLRRAGAAPALVSWAAVALLIAATVALIGAPSHAGPIFDGLLVGRRCSAASARR